MENGNEVVEDIVREAYNEALSRYRNSSEFDNVKRRDLMNRCYSLWFTMSRLGYLPKVAERFLKAAVVWDCWVNRKTEDRREMTVSMIPLENPDDEFCAMMGIGDFARALSVDVGPGPWSRRDGHAAVEVCNAYNEMEFEWEDEWERIQKVLDGEIEED